MEEIRKCEDVLVSLLVDGVSDSDFVVDFVNEIKTGNFLDILLSPKSEEIYTRNLDEIISDASIEELLKKSVCQYIEENCTSPEKQLEVLCIGIASLHAFIQANWTGPPLKTDVSPCIIPWIESWFKKSRTNTKDLQDHLIQSLVLDGEACNPNMTNPELLLIARITMETCCKIRQTLPSSRWWLLRYLFIHQQVLDEYSPKLHTEITKLIEELEQCEPIMIKDYNKVCFHLETTRIFLYYRYVTQSLEHMKIAAKAANIAVELVGALGLRTKFQVKELPQLTVKVLVSENRAIEFPTIQLEKLPKDVKLDDEVRLERIKFSAETDGKFPVMDPLEQAVVLGMFHQTLKSQPKDDLSNEELLPYLTCILAHPLTWSLQMSALLERSRIDQGHRRSVERAMMQTEELVHCYAKEDPHVRSRHYYIFCSYLPPKWTVEALLAQQLVSLGIVKSALDIYLRLQMWENVIGCYNMLNMRHKASEIIKQELNKKETVKLWCLLGDATDDPTCYERAWELSGHKSGQAQRHWGLHYFNKRKYAESIPHLRESLAINSLQVSLWFRLGYAALDQEDWPLCASAYQRYCSLDPESFEAWNNLSKAYVKMNQKFRAWKTLQEALKWDYENWKLWDNYMVVSVDVGEFHEVIKAYNRILDLKPKHVDIEVLKIIVETLSSKNQDPQLLTLAEKLFTRLTQEVRNNSSVWQHYVKLMLIHSTNNDSFETVEKRLSCLQKGFWTSIQDSRFEHNLKECILTMQIISELADATFECCEKSPTPQKAIQMLLSLRLSLKTLIARVKKFYAHKLSDEENSQHTELSALLQNLESKLEKIIVEVQQRKGSI